MAKFSEKFFCPAPWTHMYWQMNSPSPCHVIRNYQFNKSPNEYINSEWLKNLKTDMLSGKAPDACVACRKQESLGLKSTRGAHWGYYNVGPEPEYEDMWFANRFKADTETDPFMIELRFSNLCNMKCRMCDETSSSEWAKEKIKNNIPFISEVSPVSREKNISLVRIDSSYIEELKDLALKSKYFRGIRLTGGEPFIIKEYYEYLDFLVQHNLNSKIDIELYTNCTVYNPLFVDRLKQFRSINFVISIDSVGKAADYIRSGGDWATIKENAINFNKLAAPFNIYFNTAISSYALLNLEDHAKFLMELYADNPNIQTKCYHVRLPTDLHFSRLFGDSRKVAIEKIEKAVEILNVPNFEIFTTELTKIKSHLLENLPDNPKLFYDFTMKYDALRNDSFEDTFGFTLDPKQLEG